MIFQTEAEKNKFIEKYIPLAKIIASRIYNRLPQHLDKGEIESMAFLGLIDAVEKFAPEKEIKFQTYAEWRIKGTILDGLRKMDDIPRGMRKSLKLMDKITKEFELLNGRLPDDDELSKAMEIDVETLEKLKNSLRGALLGKFAEVNNGDNDDGFEEGNIAYLPDIEGETPLAIFEKKELVEIIGKKIETLSNREKIILSLYFFEEMTMKEIGQVVELTESRVSQILTTTLLKLRQYLIKSVGVVTS